MECTNAKSGFPKMHYYVSYCKSGHIWDVLDLMYVYVSIIINRPIEVKLSKNIITKTIEIVVS